MNCDRSVLRALPSISLVTLLTAVLVSIGCNKLPTSPKQNQGNTGGQGVLDGTVVQGPINPVQRDSDKNTAPLAGATIGVENAAAIRVATATSDSMGRYMLVLDTGWYRIEALPLKTQLPRPSTPPIVLTLKDGDTSRADFSYDTGIR